MYYIFEARSKQFIYYYVLKCEGSKSRWREKMIVPLGQHSTVDSALDSEREVLAMLEAQKAAVDRSDHGLVGMHRLQSLDRRIRKAADRVEKLEMILRGEFGAERVRLQPMAVRTECSINAP
jgi:hypothetical protein